MKGSIRQLRVAVVYNGNVVNDRLVTGSAPVTIGQENSNTLLLPPVGMNEGFELFRRGSEGYMLRLTDHMSGKLHIRNENVTLEELIKRGEGLQKAGSAEVEHEGKKVKAEVFETVVRPGDWGLIDLGEVGIFFQFVIPPAAVASASSFGGLGGVLGTAALALFSVLGAGLLLSAMAQLGFIIYVGLTYNPDEDDIVVLNDEQFQEFFASDLETPEVIEPELELPEPELDTASKRAGGEEGEMGDEEEIEEEHVLPDWDGEMVEEMPEEIGIKATMTDLLGPTGTVNVGLFSSGQSFGTAADQIAVAGEGDALNLGFGYGGMGYSGRGKGGGGTGAGRLGGLADKDQGGGKGSGKGLGKKKEVKIEPKLELEAPAQDGYCKKDNITDVVSKKSKRIKSCYERELLAEPDLAGKIIVQWKVQLDGSVSDEKIKSTTMKNSKVEKCISRVVSGMKFDPPDGGICVIEFPFVFVAN